MSNRIQLRRGTAATWASNNPTLSAGEPGFETDTGKTKLGDGATAWNSLGYQITAQQYCQVVATANVASLSGLTAIDGYTPSNNDLVLLVGQTTGSQNGPWVVHSGAWTRPIWYLAGTVVIPQTILVTNGVMYAGTLWGLLTTSAITVDTTATTWQIIVATGEIAYAENVTGTGTSTVTAATAVDVSGVSISVPPSILPVYIEYGALIQVVTATTSTAARALLDIIETTSGSTLVSSSSVMYPSGTGTGSNTNTYLRPLWRIGAQTTTRSFRLQIHSSGTAFVCKSLDVVGTPTFLRAFI